MPKGTGRTGPLKVKKMAGLMHALLILYHIFFTYIVEMHSEHQDYLEKNKTQQKTVLKRVYWYLC